jgi:hypothetical protein
MKGLRAMFWLVTTSKAPQTSDHGVCASRHWRFVVTPTGKGFMQVSLTKN